VTDGTGDIGFAIAPGYIETRINTFFRSDAGAEQHAVITNRIPTGRRGTPEDLTGTAVFLASDAAAYISGATMPVDGGFMGR
jgi:2-deoxy-D-gluconate 3-dehydrogenase